MVGPRAPSRTVSWVTPARRHLDAQVGATRKVLSESRAIGHTEHFTPVRLDAAVRPGLILEVTVAGHDGRRLLAA